MTRVIEFNIPTHTGIEQARGVPVRFKIGERAIRFVLQRDAENKTKWLTHFASGCRVGTLDAVAIELMCKLSPYHRFTKRQLAEALIEKLVAGVGVEKVLAQIDAAPVINGEGK